MISSAMGIVTELEDYQEGVNAVVEKTKLQIIIEGNLQIIKKGRGVTIASIRGYKSTRFIKNIGWSIQYHDAW